MTGGFVSAAIVAPLMLLAAGALVFFVTGWTDRKDATRRGQ